MRAYLPVLGIKGAKIFLYFLKIKGYKIGKTFSNEVQLVDALDTIQFDSPEDREALAEAIQVYAVALGVLEESIISLVVELMAPCSPRIDDMPLLKEFFEDFKETCRYRDERYALTEAGITACTEILNAKVYPTQVQPSRKWSYRGAGGFRFRKNIRGYGVRNGKDRSSETSC